MLTLRKILKIFKIFIFENLYSRKITIKNNEAIFSFTFDDAPISAFTNGAEILNKFNATGTYYVALGMEKNNDSTGVARRFLNHSEIYKLHKDGHSIGCHTYNHLSLRKAKLHDLIKDCESNRTGLQYIIKSSSIDHFAYPFGIVSPRGKRELGRTYKTLRTTDQGVNYGRTDLTYLRTISLCSISFNKATILEAIRLAVKNNAWLIFFSHDICSSPSEWGTKTEDFKWVVKQCSKTGGVILNVEQAYNVIIKNLHIQP